MLSLLSLAITSISTFLYFCLYYQDNFGFSNISTSLSSLNEEKHFSSEELSLCTDMGD